MRYETRPIVWRRLDCPGHESASVFSKDNEWHLQGAAVFLHDKADACRLNYEIICDSQWRTHSALVTGWVGNRPIESRVVVGPDGRWLLNDDECPQVEACIDVDLNFSPSTNLLPIRRLELSVGEEKEVHAAWLRFPSFELEPLIQLYRRVDEHTYRYESAGGKFVRDLTVNEDGFVTNYPELWQAEIH
jgi:uncharacterized protein